MRARRILAVGIAALLLIPMGCREGEPGEKAIRIGISIYKGDDTYIADMTASLQESVEAYRKESQATQNDQIDRFLSLNYDALCVNLVDRTDAGRVVDKARAANVPLIFFNREPVLEDLTSWSKVYYVGSDARESAELQAGIVLERWREDRASLDLNGDGILQYVMLEGETRHQDTSIRTEVPIQILKDAEVPLERVDGGQANWSRSQAAALTEGYFTDHGSSIELIFCNNDDMALGAAAAVERLGLDFHNIVGIDGTPKGIAAVDEGKMLGTVVMDCPAHGETVFRMARAMAMGEDVTTAAHIREDRSVRIPMYVYTGELGESAQ